MQRASFTKWVGWLTVAVWLGLPPVISEAAPPARKAAVKRARPRPAAKPAPRPAPPVEEPVNEPVTEPVEATPAAAAEAAPPAPAAATPEPTPAPSPARAKSDREAPDLAALRGEYESLKDALFRSRARKETLENALLSTQLVTRLSWEGSRYHRVERAEIRLDGVRLWESREPLSGDKPLELAPKGASSGPHVLSVRIEVRPRENPKLGYISEQNFALDLPEGKKTTVQISVDEDGDLPSYNPEIEIEVSH